MSNIEGHSSSSHTLQTDCSTWTTKVVGNYSKWTAFDWGWESTLLLMFGFCSGLRVRWLEGS